MATQIILTVPNERAEEFDALLFEEKPFLLGITTTRERDFYTDFIIDREDEDLSSWLEVLLTQFLNNQIN